ncbi:MAG: ECF transporter S component [Defluviitaleaceae bacterium]|nr:ECF transporter S component [Defluviitaleaceae bacterium]
MSRPVQNLVLAALFFAIGIILPVIVGNTHWTGAMLLPMHLPVLMAGIILGPRYAGIIGILLPITAFLLGHAPPFPHVIIAMSFELPFYGIAAGILFGKLPKTFPFLMVSLVGAMIIGRVASAIANLVVLNLFTDTPPFSFEVFLTGAFVTALPGIIIQIVLIPILIVALQRAGWKGGTRT